MDLHYLPTNRSCTRLGALVTQRVALQEYEELRLGVVHRAPRPLWQVAALGRGDVATGRPSREDTLTPAQRSEA